MEAIPLFVSSQCNTLPIAQEIEALLLNEDWCRVELLPINPSTSIDSSPESGLYILVHREQAALSALGRKMHSAKPHSVHVFVNLFNYPFPCLNLLNSGFDDFLVHPFRPDELIASLKDLWARREMLHPTEPESLKASLTLSIALRDLVGLSPVHANMLNEIRVIARSDAPVLITGETGTGKDMCARAIHYSGARGDKPFIPVNCGGIPEELFENEFFGHERGAFTDARDKFAGLVREAEGGTLFLDDVESLSLRNQAKLLRFIQEGSYLPLGTGKLQRANIRIITATNADLAEQIEEGTFRQDLYYRLAVLTLAVPPLRDRVEDVPALTEYFLERYCSMYEMSPIDFTDSALHVLQEYSWPGNVRELENVIHCAVVHANSSVIDHIEIPTTSLNYDLALPLRSQSPTFNNLKREVVETFERNYVERLLKECKGNISEAARRAGKNRRAFWELMRKYSIKRSVR